MGIMDALRRAGHEGKSLARRSMDWGRHEAEDMQSAARRKWRVNRPAETGHNQRQAADPQREGERRVIVSINGEDVDRLDPQAREGEAPGKADPHKQKVA